MILSIAAIPEAERLAEIRSGLAKLEWQDGRATAGAVASKVKVNEQAIMSKPAARAVQQMVMPLILDNPIVKTAARPRNTSGLLISKTQNGGHYGAHVDNAIMGKGAGQLRTDIAFTLFLTDPCDYEGGELVVQTAGMMQTVKAPAGNLVLYPANSIHEVKPVTSGARIVAVGWIESHIRDVTKRELLFDMANMRGSLRQKLPEDAPELLMLDKSIANLMRMWAGS